MAKRTFSTLEAFLIFLLVIMTVITVALLTLLFVTSGTIENHKDSGNHWFSTTLGSTTTQPPPITQTPNFPSFRNFSGYYIGVGRADCTGQVSDINLMGYGKMARMHGVSSPGCSAVLLSWRIQMGQIEWHL